VKYPGLYLYFDWLKGLDRIPPTVAMEIIRNLWHYAEERIEPVPVSEPLYDVIQIFLMEQLKRSLQKSETNKKNARFRQYGTVESPQKSHDGMTDEEMLEAFRTDEAYREDNPEDLLALQRIIQKKSNASNQTNS
jgi:hypothetical protein